MFFCRGEFGVFPRRDRRKLRAEPVLAFFGKFAVEILFRQNGITKGAAYKCYPVFPYVYVAAFP